MLYAAKLANKIQLDIGKSRVLDGNTLILVGTGISELLAFAFLNGLSATAFLPVNTADWIERAAAWLVCTYRRSNLCWKAPITLAL